MVGEGFHRSVLGEVGVGSRGKGVVSFQREALPEMHTLKLIDLEYLTVGKSKQKQSRSFAGEEGKVGGAAKGR